MQNVKMTVDKTKKTLTIIVDLSQKHGPSKSGKSEQIASTLGIVGVPVAGFENVKVGLNVFTPTEKPAKSA